MKKTIDIRPIYDERNGIRNDALHYHVELNLYTDTHELADISYIMVELTKTVAHIEYAINKMKESRKGTEVGDLNADN